MSDNKSRLYRLIEERLDTTLAEFVDVRRRPDIRPPASWEAIAAELTEKTRIEISHAGLRKWFPEYTGTTELAASEPTQGGAR